MRFASILIQLTGWTIVWFTTKFEWFSRPWFYLLFGVVLVSVGTALSQMARSTGKGGK